MTNKIKDLTEEEMRKICLKYHDCDSDSKVNCPLWYASSCLKVFIKKMRYIEKEVKIDE